MEALEAEVRELRQNIVSPRSKGIYRNSQIHFLMWLLNNQRDFLSDEFIAQANIAPKKRQFVKSFMNQAPEQPPTQGRVGVQVRRCRAAYRVARSNGRHCSAHVPWG